MMPMVLDAVGVVNIAALPMQQLPLMGRMLLQRCRSPQTRDLAIVMQGRAKYWLVKGFLRADKSSACAKPTPKTHPLLTRKINVLSTLLAKQHIRELNKKVAQKQIEELTETTEVKKPTAAATRNITPVQQSLLRSQPPSLAHLEKETNAPQNSKSVPNTKFGESVENNNTLQKKLQPAVMRGSPTSCAVHTKTTDTTHKAKSSSGLSMLQELIGNSQYSEMKTNIIFRKVRSNDIDEMNVLDVTTEPHRWLVLDLYRDFSHIYVPDFQELVSLDRIQKVMAFSKQKQKIVKLQFFQNAAYDAFVIPNSERKIFFGPIKMNMPPPSLILLQSVDGKMMLRETYQKMHNIQGGSRERDNTTAFCIVRKRGQVYMDYKLDGSVTEATVFEKEKRSGEKPTSESVQQPESDDDDCMIVEDAEPSGSFSALEPLPQPNITVKPLSQLQSKPNNSISSRQLTNFTIESNANSKRLQITHLGTTPVNDISNNSDLLASAQLLQTQMSVNGSINSQLVQLPNVSQSQITPSADKQSAAILCGLPPNAVITGVTPAPQEAPYATTIYISNIPATVPVVANGAQGHDATVATTIATNTLENISNVRFLTPDVRVTATGDSTLNELLATPALTTMSNSNSGLFTLPISQQQSSLLDTRESIESSTMPVAAEITTKVTPGELKSSANSSTGDWKRLLLGDNSKHSTIGSTTITKMSDKLESDGKMVMDIEEDEFEPAASIVFKSNATALSTVANELPFTAGVGNNSNTCTINGTTAITICPPTIATKTKPATQTATIVATKTNTSSTKTKIAALPYRKLSSQKERKTAQSLITPTVCSNSITPTYSSMTRTASNNSTTLNSAVEMSKASSASISNAYTKQQVAGDSRPMKLTKTQSLGLMMNSPKTNGGNVFSPKPLINVRPAVPLPQRVSSTTQRLSDSALLSPHLLNGRLSGPMAAKRPFPTPSLHKTPSDKNNVSSKQAETDVKNSTQLGKSKPSEQYGVLCSSTNDGSPRFWAKRMHNSYLIKVPGISTVVHRTDFESVDTYLNQHLLKQSPAMKSKLPIKWNFVPSEQLNLPIKRLTAKKHEKVVIRCAKPTENNAPESKVVSSSADCNVGKNADIATPTTLDKKCAEPIIIED